ncbi:MAG TPA: RHS repeat-associated core domain-containing protein [Nitrosomonas sp.]|nr:RHS repeat-associated core domain-containing protein [Nitrosomonas sp.]
MKSITLKSYLQLIFINLTLISSLLLEIPNAWSFDFGNRYSAIPWYHRFTDVKEGVGSTPLEACKDYFLKNGFNLPHKLEVKADGVTIKHRGNDPYSVSGPACAGFFLSSDPPQELSPFGFELYKRGKVNFFKNLGNNCSAITNNGTNPINIGIGNKFQTEIDYLSNTLSYSRTYNYGLEATSQGNGWRSNFNKYLRVDALYPDSRVYIFRESGAVIKFDLVYGNWISDSDITDQLIELKDEAGVRTGWNYIISATDSIEYYSAVGRLQKVKQRSGRILTFYYDEADRLIIVEDDINRRLQFAYNESNLLTALIDVSGNVYHYGYDLKGNLINVYYPDGTTRSYHYNELHYTGDIDRPEALTGITDGNGNRYSIYRYGIHGEAISSEHANGIDLHQVNYLTEENTVITDPLGSQKSYSMAAIQGVVRSTGQSQPAGSGCNAASSSLDYDEQGNIVSQIDFNGNRTCYAYDLDRNLEIARVEGLSTSQSCPTDLVSYNPTTNSTERKTLTSWHLTFQLPQVITESNRETKIDYDDRGNITHYHLRDLSSPASRAWTINYHYHPTVPGLILQTLIDGPRTDLSDITTIDFYPPDANCNGHYGCRGLTQRITNALGHQTQMTRYNAHGQIEEMIDPNGLVTTLMYDARQRLLNRVVGTEITNYAYDDAGQLIKVILPDGSSLRYTYDAAHRLIGINDNLGNRIHYTLDSLGNPIREEIFDPLNTLTQTHRSEYDALGRLWKSIGAQNQITEWGYDPNGNFKQSINPSAFTTTNQFDALNRLTQMTDPAQGLTRLQYNHQDEITQVTAPNGVVTSYTYNGLGDLTREMSADRGLIKYAYDSAGNLKTVTDARGVKHTYFWDALNRPLKRSHSAVTGIPGTTIPTWQYDAGAHGTGRLTSITDGSGSTQFSYDQQGRLVSKAQTTKLGTVSITHTLGYTYDQTGKLTQTTYPSGAQISTLYGIDGRPNEILLNGTTLIRDITYQPFGTAKSWVWWNNQTYTRQFDTDGRLTQYPNGNTARTIHFDEAGRIAQYLHTDSPSLNRIFTHDSLDRLASEVGSTSMALWTYDANGNRIASQPGSQLYTYDYLPNSNRLLSVSGSAVKSYSYDLAGNIISDGSTSYTYNTGGRLSRIDRAGKTNWYFYNAFGERVIKAGAWLVNGPYRFVYDSDGKLIGEYDKNGPRQETVWLDDTPIAVIKKNSTGEFTVYQIHADHLNTPRAILDSQNRVVWQWHSGAFGETLPEEDPDGDGAKFEYNLRFPGQYWDKETNLHYNYFRDYDPEIGRYVQSDPIGLLGGLNTYGYVEQNPLSFTDPTGEAIPAIIAACAGNPACAVAVSAGVGAISSVVLEVASQLLSNGGNLQCTDIGSVAISAMTGAIPLGAVGALGSKIITKSVTKGKNTVIGRVKDLQKLRQGEKSLLDELLDQGSPKANWRQNSSVLRKEMLKGRPIRDTSPGDKRGQFLNAERNLLEDRGWKFDGKTNYWIPPLK